MNCARVGTAWLRFFFFYQLVFFRLVFSFISRLCARRGVPQGCARVAWCAVQSPAGRTVGYLDTPLTTTLQGCKADLHQPTDALSRFDSSTFLALLSGGICSSAAHGPCGTNHSRPELPLGAQVCTVSWGPLHGLTGQTCNISLSRLATATTHAVNLAGKQRGVSLMQPTRGTPCVSVPVCVPACARGLSFSRYLAEIVFHFSDLILNKHAVLRSTVSTVHRQAQRTTDQAFSRWIQ